MADILPTAAVLFLCGFIGDIILQFLSVSFWKKTRLFQSFWDEHGRWGGAFRAGLITLLIGGAMFLLALAIYNQLRLDTKSWSFVFFAMSLGFVLGVFLDVATNRGNWIPSLKTWYDTVGDTEAAFLTGGFPFALVLFITAIFWMYYQ